MSSREPLHVLVVDDSAVVRQTVKHLLPAEEGWRLSTAPDPVVGLERIRVDRPDVILLDLEMPRMDGLTFLRHLMATDPIPVVVCSGYVGEGTQMALSALEAGAVEILPKPRLAVKKFLQDPGLPLASLLRHAAAASPSLERRWRPGPTHAVDLPWSPVDRLPLVRPGATAARRRAVPSVAPRPMAEGKRALESRRTARGPDGGSRRWRRVVLLGASMGGPDAIRRILADLPPDGPACVVVQHMPEIFTAEFARRLDRVVSPHVREVADGDRPQPGLILIAPGGRHVIMEDGVRGPVLRLVDSPPLHGHRPSVDMLFESAARVLGADVVAAVLTGMGEDGASGLLALSEAGARTVVQDRDTSTVFGMPGAALERGAASRAVPLDRMSTLLLRLAAGGEKEEAP